jgi:glycosyltransferase involved in cell wall biosynthesis
MAGFDFLRRNVRRVLKLGYWLLTPWRMPQRLRSLREGVVREARARNVALLIEQERSRLNDIRNGRDARTGTLDVYSLTDALDAAAVPQDRLVWPIQDVRSIHDSFAAARFVVDLLRARADLRERFPRALSASKQEGFSAWLLGKDARQELGINDNAAQHLVALFSADFADRARQRFLTTDEIRTTLPHGLTPAGSRSLFKWFVQHDLAGGHLRIEEVWWLFMQAAEDPQAELVRAYLFTPEWQRLFPEALTVFGWAGFSSWFVVNFGVDGAWVDPLAAPDVYEPALQIRLAYWARSAWRTAHPHALSHTSGARAMLQWLGSSLDAKLPVAMQQWCAALDPEVVVPALLQPRVNIIGHFCYPSGLRVSVEAMTGALELAGTAVSLRDVRTDVRDDPCHARFGGLETADVTVIHVQPEPFFEEVYARADLAERAPRTYRIAYWYWEFDSIPEAWCAHAEQVDEVWTATEFIAHGLRKQLTVPVRTLFPGVTLAPFEARERAHFGLDPDRFTFLFTFHMLSVMERKNPLGLIRAFRQAFPADEKASLILKTSFGDRHPAQLQELRDAADGAPITIIDQVFSPDEVLSLMNACDAYVSLHRSEGLGLTLAEAMLMGKPVIATAFSGNMDFMTPENSLLVRYERVKLAKPIPPYEADLEWAEPSIEEAAQYMRSLYEDQEWAREIGERGRQSALQNLSLEESGRRFSARLAEIRAIRTRELPGAV